ncbi:hypothetical protein ACLEEZ_09885 [Lonsdalea quercina]
MQSGQPTDFLTAKDRDAIPITLCCHPERERPSAIVNKGKK